MYCLDIIVELDRQAKALVSSGLQPSTNRTYNSAQRSYIKFCQQYKLIAVPTNEQILLWFVAHLHARGIKSNSMQVYLSAVRSVHVLNGFQAPVTFTPRIKLALKAAFELGDPAKPKAPITYPLLVRMIDLVSHGYDSYMWSALLTLAFYGALRGAEYSLVMGSGGTVMAQPPVVNSISFGIAPYGVKFMTFRISKSKTQPHGFTAVIGCSGTRVCAVCAMTAYLAARHRANQLQANKPLFLLYNGQVITKDLVNTKIKSLVSQLDLPPADYTTHSLRAGSVTSAGFTNQFADWELQQLGHWSSDTYRRYIRNTDLHQVTYASRIAKSLPPNTA